MLSLSNLKNECCILTLTIHAANYVPAQITKNTTGVLERKGQRAKDETKLHCECSK